MWWAGFGLKWLLLEWRSDLTANGQCYRALINDCFSEKPTMRVEFTSIRNYGPNLAWSNRFIEISIWLFLVKVCQPTLKSLLFDFPLLFSECFSLNRTRSIGSSSFPAIIIELCLCIASEKSTYNRLRSKCKNNCQMHKLKFAKK